MIKVLYLPLNSLEVKQEGMYDAFNQCGVELYIFDYYTKKIRNIHKDQINSEFIEMVKNIKPDLIHCQLQFTGVITLESLRQAKVICPNVIITDWTGDIRNGVEKDFINMSNGTDISMISSVGQLEMYRKQLLCPRVEYWQIGYNPKYYFELNKTQFDYDISFIANNFINIFPDSALRLNAANLIQSTSFRFGLFGGGWNPSVKTVTQQEANIIYNNSVCCLSISNYNDVYLYFSDRLLMCLASGRPTLCYRFPGWEHYFTHMKDIIIINDLNEIPGYVNLLKSDPKLANDIGAAGANIVKREHTYFSRALELLRKVGLE